jgi:DNA-binding CsgD family transcriptional regulator
MRALLGRLAVAQAEQAPPQGVPLSCLARLVQAFDGKGGASGSGRSAAPAVPGLVEPLTGRELEVLGMLAVGTPNQRIAEELVITLDTAKKARQPCPRQARRGQPQRGCRPSTGLRPDLLAERRSPIRWHLRARTPPRKDSTCQVHLRVTP